MSDFQQQITALVNATHTNPHQVLGLRAGKNGYLRITTFKPQAVAVKLIDKKSNKVIATLEKVDDAGVFSKQTRRKKVFDYLLQIEYADHQQVIEDSYAFSNAELISDFDLHLLAEGQHQKPYQILGAHPKTIRQVSGVQFAVWAPNASKVSVIGDFNQWDGRLHVMQNHKFSGFWQIFVTTAKIGDHYKFEIKDQSGNLLPLKADPMASQAQLRPDTASIVAKPFNYQWHDENWLKQRQQLNSRNAPISIYEVNLGSWKKHPDGRFLSYTELAEQLIPYVVEMGFTHIQLMPVSEYPFDGSWGYQPIGLFAPTSRFGTPEQFQHFVDACHQANLGLLVDWVPGHFPTDEHGLAKFDGTCLYEHEDPRQGFHPDWNTLIYNYGRTEVVNFLTASALHWLDNYHVDGIRVDAVASMLYLDYSRKEGEWIPNKHGGRENLEAVNFLQNFNRNLYQQYPGTFSVAEESTSWPGVSRPTDNGGLGFGYKWNMGWMNDTLEYMKRDPIHRQYHHNEMSFSLVYAFDENFILPLSHDEVVHGKGSILARMPGDTWQKFANLRSYYGFMWAHPGKKLLFMGSEFAQGREWDHDNQLDWHQLDIHWHQGVQQLVKDLNQVYRSYPALHQLDCEPSGFCWLDHNNAKHSIFSFVRFDEKRQQPVVVVCNFAPQVHHHFKLGVPNAGFYREILNTDAECYGGSNQGNNGGVQSTNMPYQNQPNSIDITVPPLATVMFVLDNF